MCVISALEEKRLLHKRLLHKGCEAYLTHVIDKSTLEVTLNSVLVDREFPNIFSEDLSGLPLDRELELELEI